jgi:hypothetical protein
MPAARHPLAEYPSKIAFASGPASATLAMAAIPRPRQYANLGRGAAIGWSRNGILSHPQKIPEKPALEKNLLFLPFICVFLAS